jgi:hypothetical protein
MAREQVPGRSGSDEVPRILEIDESDRHGEVHLAIRVPEGREFADILVPWQELRNALARKGFA